MQRLLLGEMQVESVILRAEPTTLLSASRTRLSHWQIARLWISSAGSELHPSCALSATRAAQQTDVHMLHSRLRQASS